MSRTDLQARLHRGRKTAARVVGTDTDVYRPSGPAAPLAAVNRYQRMPAAFAPSDGRFSSANAYGEALWYGLFDASNTRVGDYLVQDGTIWFIAAQQRLVPVLCVQTNRIVSFSRAAAPSSPGVNTYGGVTPATSQALMKDWPASVLGISGAGRPDTNLPSDSSVPYWTVLLPSVPGVVLRPADLISDDLGRNAVVAAAELSDLGWRVTAKQATT